MASAEAALLEGCREGSMAKVLAALDAGASATDASDERGWTALHWACHGGRGVVLKEMLDRGADVEAVGEDGETALLVACGRGEEGAEAAGLLLGRAEGPGTVHMADLMGNYPLHCAASAGCAAVVGLLLKHGASPSVRNGVHLTPLDIAVGPAAALLAALPPAPTLPAGLSSTLLTLLAVAAPSATPISQAVTRDVCAALLSYADPVDHFLRSHPEAEG